MGLATLENIRKMPLFMGITCLFLLGLIGFTSTPSYGVSELARVNGRVISLEEFNQKYQENLQFFHFNKPSRSNVLKDLIKRELAVQEARRLGIHKDPRVVEQVNTLLYRALLEKKLAPDLEKIKVSDEEARSFYRRNPEIRTSHIFVAVPPGSTAKQIQGAKRRIQIIWNTRLGKEKMNFAEAAQRFSEGPSAPMGGDIDYKTKDQLDPKYYRAAVALKRPGRVSGIVRSEHGFHIIKLTGIRSWAETDRPKIKRLLLEKRQTEYHERYLASLRKKAKVSVNSRLLRK